VLIWAKNSLCEVKFKLLGQETGEVSKEFGDYLIKKRDFQNCSILFFLFNFILECGVTQLHVT
jgi:hypothetical protein